MQIKKKYVTGDLKINAWRPNESQQLTFVVTQDCNLRCKYCYMVGKNNKNVMNFETAKKIIDYFVDNRESLFALDYLVLDFIGGEPLLEIKLIDQIVDYFRLTTYQKKSKWFGRFRISVQSNGVLVDNEEVQKFLRKNRDLVSLGITIDGTQEKHDLQRVFPNNEGSYSIVEKNYKKAMQQGLTRDTKVTFGQEDLKYLKESIIHLWSLGIQNVPANVVYEDVWEKGDDEVFEEQLTSLADYIIEHDLWDKYNTSFFDDSLGYRVSDDSLMTAICGTGRMFCVDAKGDIYNCVRFMEYSLNGKTSKKIGDVYHGVDFDKVRALRTLFPKYISEKKCIDCKVNMECTYCAGYNYDASPNDSMYYRSTAICDMHKARVRANNYFWARLYNEKSIERVVPYRHEYFMYFILSSQSVNYCRFSSAENEMIMMKPEDLLRGLEYAFQNFYQPVFVHSDESMQWLNGLLESEGYGSLLAEELKRHIVKHIVKYKQKEECRDVIYVMDETTDRPEKSLDATVIFNVKADKIGCLADMVGKVLPYASRVNINLLEVNKDFDVSTYEEQLDRLKEILFTYLNRGERKEIRQLTDRIFLRKMNNCFAGEKNITFAPDGKFYYCPAFYFDKDSAIDFEKNRKMTYLSNAPACDHCDAYQCNRCVYENYVKTEELNTPAKMQCTISYLDRKYSAELLKKLQDAKIPGYENVNIPSVNYNDPLEVLAERNKARSVSLL